ncbi:NINE protein [Allocoleopsis franciscana]|uniref:Putative membrane protein n=1 Tax=Allocoleopsis franciscana PCC 7113 TaxID=1173027 RepID=K9W9S8_9CYAN|nr:NINE protein [Allocoleopsis franciscana]AFZ16529.1 putative membrane protein [Allocoleopsis franciscana PCC 7113]
MRKTKVAYILWCTCFVGLAGVHRLYSGKYLSGLVWLFTLGFLGIGQLIDLALIPGMIEEKNLKDKWLSHRSNNHIAIIPEVVVGTANEIRPTFREPTNKVELSDIQTIFQLAKDNQGKVSLVDCVIATGKPASELRKALEYLCLEGFLAVDNYPEPGSLVYKLV